MKSSLNLREVEALLRASRVEVAPEDAMNPLVIALSLGLIDVVELERVKTGFFNRVDQSRMITDGRLVAPIAFGQCVLQAVRIEEVA